MWGEVISPPAIPTTAARGTPEPGAHAAKYAQKRAGEGRRESARAGIAGRSIAGVV